MADEEDDLELQDQPAAPVAPPQPVAPPAPTPMPPQAIQPAGPNRPVAGPGYIYMGQNAGPAASRPVGLPSVSAQPWLNQVADYQKDMVGNAMMKEARSDPNLATAQKAVQAATQYQAQRGYDKDLQNGMPADQAMTKWGPMLFGQSGAGMSRMASTVRAMRPPPPQLRSVGGRLWNVNPTGTQATPLTPETKPKEKTWSFDDKADYNNANSEIKRLDAELNKTPSKDPDLRKEQFANQDMLKHQKFINQLKINELKRKYSEDSTDTSSARKPSDNSPKEVTRRTKDGRKAVFDASTKEFIRYAD